MITTATTSNPTTVQPLQKLIAFRTVNKPNHVHAGCILKSFLESGTTAG